VAVPFVDLGPIHRGLREELDAAWRRVTESDGYIGGRAVTDFEDRWAAYCGRAYGVGVANGTDAIEIGLQAAGIGPGDEVIVPANTFIATVEAVVAAGATPVLVDVDADSLLVTASTISEALTPRTAAVIIVHLFGHVVPMDEIAALTRERGLLLIEDAAQAHGAKWKDRPAGSCGQIATFSFYPSKNLGAFGDAGAIVTDDPGIARRAREIGNHGSAVQDRTQHHVLGRNSRLDALQAAILDVKLNQLDAWNRSRQIAVDSYQEAFAGHPLIRPVATDRETDSVHHLFVVRVPQRERVRAHLDARGIGSGVHYPVPCHLHPPYMAFARAPLPAVEQAATEILSLPMFASITEAQVAEAGAALVEAVEAIAASSVPAQTAELAVGGSA
jgi:dTDP-4-amino-4,6-dideoxygalactose transaminase